MKRVLIVAGAGVLVLGSATAMHAAEEINKYEATIDVQESKGDKGKAWDAFGGAPDIVLEVDGTARYTSGACFDTYHCVIEFVSKKKNGLFSTPSWRFSIDDADVAENDHVGGGRCSFGGTCRLGRATISIR